MNLRSATNQPEGGDLNLCFHPVNNYLVFMSRAFNVKGFVDSCNAKLQKIDLALKNVCLQIEGTNDKKNLHRPLV